MAFQLQNFNNALEDGINFLQDIVNSISQAIVGLINHLNIWTIFGSFLTLAGALLINHLVYNKGPNYITKNVTFLQPEMENDRLRFSEVTPSNFSRNIESLKLIVHGFGSTGCTGPCLSLSKEYLKLSIEVTIICVDWSPLSQRYLSLKSYDDAVTHVPYVADEIVGFLTQLMQARVLKPKNVHLVGHSLGAHIVGLTGKKFKWPKLHRITGLDPAAPYFAKARPTERIHAGDALHLDVYHTSTLDNMSCAKGFLTNYLPLGIIQAVGEFDIYVNGGFHQPACNIIFGLYNAKCSHNRAIEIFSASIFAQPTEFIANRCFSVAQAIVKSCPKDNLRVVGEYLFQFPTGCRIFRSVWYLNTTGSYPFAKGINI